MTAPPGCLAAFPIMLILISQIITSRSWKTTKKTPTWIHIFHIQSHSKASKSGFNDTVHPSNQVLCSTQFLQRNLGSQMKAGRSFSSTRAHVGGVTPAPSMYGRILLWRRPHTFRGYVPLLSAASPFGLLRLLVEQHDWAVIHDKAGDWLMVKGGGTG